MNNQESLRQAEGVQPGLPSATLLACAVRLLKVSVCPNCDGSGSKPVPLGEHFVSHEMAMDACDPSMEGASMGIEWGQEQCQWCDEKNQLIAAYEAQANIRS